MSGPGCARRAFTRFGPQLLRSTPRLVRLELESSASRVPLSRYPRLLLLSSEPSLMRVELVGRFCHWEVGAVCTLWSFSGYHGACHDSEALAETGFLFDAVLGELAAVAGCQPMLIVGEFNVEANQILCWLKGIRNGMWVDLGEAWARPAGKTSGVTSKMCLGSSAGSRRDFMVACLLAAASLLSCEVVPDRGVQHHIAVRAAFSSGRWGYSVCNHVSYAHVWPACWLPVVGKSRESKPAEIMKVWEVYDDRSRFMSAEDSMTLHEVIRSRENFYCVGSLVLCCGKVFY